ncbi:hypothetical protein ABS71_00810 [bacterium SCN 62-11]|nr:MAG: hypothetical protein ABS71_00810 [bacterium SCN 62-11]
MTRDLIRIGDLSRVTGVPIATLRYYESEGLIECVRARSKYRMFPKGTVDIVGRIVHLKSLKIPLSEIRRIFTTARQSEEEASLATQEHYLELKQRLAHILERKRVWEEQERQVRLLLESLPAAAKGGDEHV